jgi:hypothetical protein
MTNHMETIQTYYDLSARKEYRAAAARVIGDGYTFIDHTTGVVANTPELLEVALKEDSQWSDQKYLIKEALETTDEAVVVLLTVTQTLTGEWRSVKGEGQRVQREVCEIFRFDTEGRIVFDEVYEDALSIMQQLGAVSV